jgi:CRP-like cAMP-binding protein
VSINERTCKLKGLTIVEKISKTENRTTSAIVDLLIDIPMFDTLNSTALKIVIIASLTRGRSIGEMAIIDDYPRSATIKAWANSTLVTLTREGFEQILDQHSAIGIKLLKEISRLLSMNLRRTSSQLADYLLPKNYIDE